MRHSLRRARLRVRPTARATVAATATVMATTISGALLLCAFTAPGTTDPDPDAAARCAAGAPGACVGGAPLTGADRLETEAGQDDGQDAPPWPLGSAAPTALPTDPALRARLPITVAPLSAARPAADGREQGHHGPPMSGDMALGGSLVLLGSGLALAVLYRSRAEDDM
ncbi:MULTISPECIES: hypothetical protein [Streptomyces]|uniref:hypothetical protein n=1 Tax=Streptomyces TaxID=1883 RepID=UPI00163BCCFF|nr:MULTISPECIES: hypothetical protein [Streptomyces]MBC2877773.1 hypothetical protein [Streptomyces sp. TYQ1024]UBI38674.1 hypothetical protein K7I03_20900 [Streptomyces mobaraensis]UKW31256.1 hypothetical protein MCU78_20855 [Streptomyces sp. TYQ1024]